jgi:glycosyltransferase involved in cell wall biosynthesis
VAAGEWIIFADADDRVAPGWIEALVTGAHEVDPQGEADIIVGASCWKRSAADNEPSSDHRGLFHGGDEMNTVWNRLFYHSEDKTALISGSMCDKLFRIELARRAFQGIYQSIRIGEDSCFTTVAFAYARAVALTYAHGYRWTKTTGSLSFSPIGCMLQDYKSVYSHARRALNDQGYGEYAGKLWFQYIGDIVGNRLYIALAGKSSWEPLTRRFLLSFEEATSKQA